MNTHRPIASVARAAPAARGFTLIELLVALFITSILFAMGYGALTQALNSRKEVEEQAARLVAVQQALRIMEQDIELMQPRPVRDLLGSGYQAPLVQNRNALGLSSLDAGTTNTATGSGAASAVQMSSALISFTRGGWANPAGLPRSELQRVGYLLRDGKLIREDLPVLDTTASVALEERELLDQVEALTFRFMDGGLVLQTDWPPQSLLPGPAHDLLRIRPVAIEITLKLKDYGTLTRLIEVAG